MEQIQHNMYYHYGSKSLSAKIIRRLIVPVIILLVSAIALVSTGGDVASQLQSATSLDIVGFLAKFGIGIAVIVGLVQIIIAWLDYKNSSFMISENALYIRTGILNRSEISIPFRHINNVLQFQNVTDRILSICRCEVEIQSEEISTTTGQQVPEQVVLRDVDTALMLPLRETLLSHANTQRMIIANPTPENHQYTPFNNQG